MLRGAVSKLFRCRDPEVLCEGPAGTGKTTGVLSYAAWCAENHPNIRQLFTHETRVAMSKTVLVTFEREVLPPTHAALRGPTKETRTSYKWPNGSETDLIGLDNPDKFRSGQWDQIFVFEATMVQESQYEMLLHRLRNFVLPWQQIIADTNPDHPQHWLNVRANAGKMTRFLSRHQDNPRYWDRETQTWTPEGQNYVVERLGALSGVRRARFLLGQWAAAEGAIWESFDPARHVVDAEPTYPDQDGQTSSKCRYYVGSVDWGFRAPGVFQVWGVTGDGDMYLVHEIYRTQQNIDWWAEKIDAAWRKWKLRAVAADPEEPGNIDKVRRMGVPIQPAFNDWMPGVDAVRKRIDDRRMFIVRDCLESADQSLSDDRKPTCLEQEIPGYVYAKTKDGRPIKEAADPGVPDHACDAARYAVAWVDRFHVRPEPDTSFKPGTIGAVLHTDVEEDEVMLAWVQEHMAKNQGEPNGA